MRFGMAMIELIFAIVIIAISIMTIPSMLNIADETNKQLILDDDIISRLSGQMIDKFQGRWGGEYTIGNDFESNISVISSRADLNCSRNNSINYWRLNPDVDDSFSQCDLLQTPREIPALSTADGGTADGNVSKGLEMLNAGTEALSIPSSTVGSINLNATYNVRYVDSNVTPTNHTSNTVTAVWRLGSSEMIGSDNGGSRGVNLDDRTHLKRVVVNFWNDDVNMTLTFFKSNKGGS